MVAALAAFAQVGCGQFSENVVVEPVADRDGFPPGAERLVVDGCAGEADKMPFLVDGVVTALVPRRRLHSQWLEEVHRAPGGME